ncbi:MAG: XRE family transcriptional regulator [Limisphaerales bacterium]
MTKVDTPPKIGVITVVDRTLNRAAIDGALIKRGLNQSALAEQLQVSREAVSKWLKGQCFPKPAKLLRMGMLLGLPFGQLVISPLSCAVPIVCFRKKSHRVTRDEHLDNARETGELLKRLVKYLPQQPLTSPPTLKNPSTAYQYVQNVAAQTRQEMGLQDREVIEFGDLIGKFRQLHAVLVPALWGERQHHGNALNIHLPDSKTTWVFLNLDSNAIDFKFWIAHELGHSLAPELTGDPCEDFADAFAQALLFPESHAAKLRPDLQRLTNVGARIHRVHKEATKHVISPYTIRRALESYEEANNIPKTDLGQIGPFMGSVTNFTKTCRTVTQTLFKAESPQPADYIKAARSAFDSPFFEALASFCKSEQSPEPFIHRVLGVSLADARALARELRK